jgi:hypothetical protein
MEATAQQVLEREAEDHVIVPPGVKDHGRGVGFACFGRLQNLSPGAAGQLKAIELSSRQRDGDQALLERQDLKNRGKASGEAPFEHGDYDLRVGLAVMLCSVGHFWVSLAGLSSLVRMVHSGRKED